MEAWKTDIKLYMMMINSFQNEKIGIFQCFHLFIESCDLHAMV